MYMTMDKYIYVVYPTPNKIKILIEIQSTHKGKNQYSMHCRLFSAQFADMREGN